MSAAKTKAQKIIDENAVGMSTLFHAFLMLWLTDIILAVFSKSYCPYCKATKQTLSELNAKFYVIELDEVGMFMPSTSSFESLLMRRVQMTEPIFRMLLKR